MHEPARISEGSSLFQPTFSPGELTPAPEPPIKRYLSAPPSPKGNPVANSMVELASKIALAQASVKSMSPDDLNHLIQTVHSTLVGLQGKECGVAGEVAAEGPVDEKLAKLREKPGKSIQKNVVVCLECGSESKVLGKTHLLGHGLSPKEYKKKWGLGARQALVTKTLSENRKATAERLGLGERLAAARGKRLANIAAAKKATPEVNLIKKDGAPKKAAAQKKAAPKKKGAAKKK